MKTSFRPELQGPCFIFQEERGFQKILSSGMQKWTEVGTVKQKISLADEEKK